MSADLALLDTNVLVYAFDPLADYHAPCRRLLDGAADTTAALCLAPQNIGEFFSVVTRLHRDHTPRTPLEAL